jgi:hypothetical protein
VGPGEVILLVCRSLVRQLFGSGWREAKRSNLVILLRPSEAR